MNKAFSVLLAEWVYIQVQLDYTLGAAKTHRLPVEAIKKPERKPKLPEPTGPNDDESEDENGKSKEVIRVKIRKKDFSEVEIPIVTPIPVKRDEGIWLTLG